MRVKITKVSGKDYWYNDKIGQVIKVRLRLSRNKGFWNKLKAGIIIEDSEQSAEHVGYLISRKDCIWVWG